MVQILSQTLDRLNPARSSISEQAETTFFEISNDIQAVNQQVNAIAEASSQQELGIQESNSAMKQLDAASTQNANAAHEAQTISNQLKSQSDELQEITTHLLKVVRGV